MMLEKSLILNLIVLNGARPVLGQMTMEIPTTLFLVQLKSPKSTSFGILKESLEFQLESSMVKYLLRLDSLTA